MKSDYLSVLLFWRDVEIFNIPKSPTYKDNNSYTKITFCKSGQALPWAFDNPKRLSADKDYTWVHTVFIGVAEVKKWAKVVLDTVIPGGRLITSDKMSISGKGWLTSFLVDVDGRPIARSLIPASFALGVARLKQGKGLDGISDDIVKAIKDFDERRQVVLEKQSFTEKCDISNPLDKFQSNAMTGIIDWKVLQEEFNIALAQLGLSLKDVSCSVVIKSVRHKCKNKEESTKDNDSEYLNSFFLNDIGRLIDMARAGETFGSALTTYLTVHDVNKKREDILKNSSSMAKCLRPEKLPAGRWPAKSSHHLMLAQQAAVSEIVSRLSGNPGLVAVNGPPGTGKTTILRDIIAEVIVQRARRLAELNGPWQAFKKTTVAGKNIYSIESKIIDGTSIVVTSNNNSAVENITRELPDQTSIAGDEFDNAAYFKEVAQNIFDKTKINASAWGLVTAVLGNSKNRNAFANGLFLNNNSCDYKENMPVDMKPLLEFWAIQGNREVANKKWYEARQYFQKLYNDVIENKKCLIKYQKLLDTQANLNHQIDKIKANIEYYRCKLERTQEHWDKQLDDVNCHYQQTTTQMESVKQLNRSAELAMQAANDKLKNAEKENAPPYWERLLGIFGFKTQRVKKWRLAVAELRAERAESAKRFSEALANLNKARQAQQEASKQLKKVQEKIALEKQQLQSKLNKNLTQVTELENEFINTREELEKIKASGICIPDIDFFKQDRDRFHLSSVWVTDELDHMRSKLFLSALELHKWTICACAGKYIANLRMFKKMLTNNPPEPLTGNERRILWDILFFLVPAVSTTLASFDRLFKDMGKESLGWLLLDEAGQATPQSVVGALWRSRRVVIIGDPLQIEPVMTVPKAVIAELRKKHNVKAYWSPMEQSAQTLADYSMNVGTRVGSVWTGLPLRAHRRCVDPMFSIANTIAYAEQMVQANKNPPTIDCVLGESRWFHVNGTPANGHVVREEINVLLKLLTCLYNNWPTLSNGNPAKIYIISPFRDIANELREVKRRTRLNKSLVDCGTVHTFQGKEAETVFIVLGSQPGKDGEGSRVWASSRPNLLNVALTRAKLRVYVIGNYNDWKNFPYFSVLAEKIKLEDANIYLQKLSLNE